MVTKAEVNFQRLLNCCEKQASEKSPDELKYDAKFYAYVSVLQEQLTALQGGGIQRTLPSIESDRAADFWKRIDSLSQLVDKQALPGLWQVRPNTAEYQLHPTVETASSAGGGHTNFSTKRRGGYDTVGGGFESAAAPPSARRRSNVPSRDTAATETAWSSGNSRERLQLDDSARALIDKNRDLQEAITDDMLGLMGQLKANALLANASLQDSEKVLDRTSMAMEHSLAGTKHAKSRAGKVNSRGWFTTIIQWLLILFICWMFLGMILLIRIT
eukprot:jgi/Mesen1/4987/ME000248S04266